MSIGVRAGSISFVGNTLAHTWTTLNAIAEPGDTEITILDNVKDQANDLNNWKVGDTIAIASTGFESFEAEERIITAISSNGLVLTLDRPLEYRHYGKDYISSIGTVSRMRAEVNNLTRNVKYQGNPETAPQA